MSEAGQISESANRVTDVTNQLFLQVNEALRPLGADERICVLLGLIGMLRVMRSLIEETKGK